MSEFQSAKRTRKKKKFSPFYSTSATHWPLCLPLQESELPAGLPPQKHLSLIHPELHCDHDLALPVGGQWPNHEHHQPSEPLGPFSSSRHVNNLLLLSFFFLSSSNLPFLCSLISRSAARCWRCSTSTPAPPTTSGCCAKAFTSTRWSSWPSLWGSSSSSGTTCWDGVSLLKTRWYHSCPAVHLLRTLNLGDNKRGDLNDANSNWKKSWLMQHFFNANLAFSSNTGICNDQWSSTC